MHCIILSMEKINTNYYNRLTYHHFIPKSQRKWDKVTCTLKQTFEAISTFFFRVVYFIRYQRFETNVKLANRLISQIRNETEWDKIPIIQSLFASIIRNQKSSVQKDLGIKYQDKLFLLEAVEDVERAKELISAVLDLLPMMSVSTAAELRSSLLETVFNIEKRNNAAEPFGTHFRTAEELQAVLEMVPETAPLLLYYFENSTDQESKGQIKQKMHELILEDEVDLKDPCPFKILEQDHLERRENKPIQASCFLEDFIRGSSNQPYTPEIFKNFASIFAVDFPRGGLKIHFDHSAHDLSDAGQPFPMDSVTEKLSRYVQNSPEVIQRIANQMELPPYKEFARLFQNEDETFLNAVKRFYRENVILPSPSKEKLDRMLSEAVPKEELNANAEAFQAAEMAIGMKLLDFLFLFTQTLAAEPTIYSMQSAPFMTPDEMPLMVRGNERRIIFEGDALNQFTLEVDCFHSDPGKDKDTYCETTRIQIPSLRQRDSYEIVSGINYGFSCTTPPEWFNSDSFSSAS